jgi:hypothetical protein
VCVCVRVCVFGILVLCLVYLLDHVSVHIV